MHIGFCEGAQGMLNEMGFARAVADFRDKADNLRRDMLEDPGDAHALLTRTLEELNESLEELQVAEEELRAQASELAESERRAVEDRARYEELFQFAPDPYLVTDMYGTILEANRAAVQRLGVDVSYLRGKPLVTFVTSDYRRQFRALLNGQRSQTSGSTFELAIQPRQGEAFIGLITVDGTHEQVDGRGLLRWMIRDITELKRLNNELQALNLDLESRVAQRTLELKAANDLKGDLLQQSRATESRYRQLFTSAVDAVLLVDEAGVIRDANPAASQLLSHGSECLVGLPLQRLLGWQPSGTNSLDTTWRGEIEARRLDGTFVPVEASIAPVQLNDSSVTYWTIRDISDRRQLARLQEEFLSMAAHELKTPLTSLKGFAQLLQRGIGGTRAAEMIVQQADHLNLLVGDLLDVARLESGHINVQTVETDLRSIVDRAIEQARALTTTHTIECESVDHPIIGYWDERRIEQVMTNLLSNAVKYAPSSRHITVRITEHDDLVRTTVQDYGPGIAPEAIPGLFMRFYRVDDPTSRGVEGMGLGLYISRIIVEAHGGTMQVASKLGEGSEFTFSLPRVAPSTDTQ
jgi:PAS domain S-box-containing protein